MSIEDLKHNLVQFLNLLIGITVNNNNNIVYSDEESNLLWDKQIQIHATNYYKIFPVESELQEELENLTMEQQIRNAVNNGICTFTVTGNNFKRQKYYRCITCNMSEGEGACISCINSCHFGHSLSELKLNYFFCDCTSHGNCKAMRDHTNNNNGISKISIMKSYVFTNMGYYNFYNRIQLLCNFQLSNYCISHLKQNIRLFYIYFIISF